MPSATAENETTLTYMFDGGPYLGFSRDRSGSNLPRGAEYPRWLFKGAFELAAHKSVPAALPPEPILRGLLDEGFYIWRKGTTHATSQ